MTPADWTALGLAYVLASGLVLLAFASASKRGDHASDEALDLIDGDIRPADLIARHVRNADSLGSFHAENQ